MTEQEQRSEEFVGRMTQIDSDCRRGGVDMRPIQDEVAAVVDAGKHLRDAAASKDMELWQRRVVSDAIAKQIREGMD